jgi:hypothetical protein
MHQGTPAGGAPGAMPHRRLVIGLGLFSAISAIGGGAELILWPRGNQFVPIELIRQTPFETFLIPGLLLTGIVGGASLASSVLAWRRSRAAIDATIVAGGALTVWIVAEAAMLRAVHWLHVLYGTLGVLILWLGVVAAWRSRLPRHRWVIAVTLAETIGFMAPALTGILASKVGLGEVPLAGLVVAAGALEGLALGAGQAWAFPLPVRRGRYALVTAFGACIVWAVVMSMLLLAGRGAGVSLAIMAPLILGAAIVGLAAIGSAQWIELRHYTPLAHRWIAWTALAWAVALPLSFTPGPFVDESSPIASHVALWGSAGVLMAYVMALMTWQGVSRLAAGQALTGPSAPREHLRQLTHRQCTVRQVSPDKVEVPHVLGDQDRADASRCAHDEDVVQQALHRGPRRSARICRTRSATISSPMSTARNASWMASVSVAAPSTRFARRSSPSSRLWLFRLTAMHMPVPRSKAYGNSASGRS